MANQYTSNKTPDIPRLDHDEIVQILVDKKINDKATTYQLVKWLTVESGYNYAPSYAYELVDDAEDTLNKVYAKMNRYSLDACIGMNVRLREEAIRKGNDTLAYKHQCEIDKLAGHYKERIEINQDITFKVKLGR